jgi:hypothetical protein
LIKGQQHENLVFYFTLITSKFQWIGNCIIFLLGSRINNFYQINAMLLIVHLKKIE